MEDCACTISSWEFPIITLSILNDIFRNHFEGKVIVRFVEGDDPTLSISLGNLKRLLIFFSDNSSVSVIVKMESSNATANEIASRHHCFISEYNFYNTLSSRCLASIPRPYYASLSSENIATTLIIEDILHAQPGDANQSLSLDQIKAAVIELAKFHGSFFDGNLADVPKTLQSISGFDRELALKTFLEDWKHVLNQYAETNEAGESINHVLDTFTHCANFFENWNCMLEMGPPSLVHGDYKGSNIMFNSSRGNDSIQGASATILDFQTIYKGERGSEKDE